MLYQLFELHRDPAVHRASYGRSETIGYDCGVSYHDLISGPNFDFEPWHNGPRPYDGTLQVGLTAEFCAPRALPLIKSVELWSNHHEVTPNGIRRIRDRTSTPVILERLFYRTPAGLWPFCWRYINQHLLQATLVHCENLASIHNELHGLKGDLSVHDPRQIYLDVLGQKRQWLREERFEQMRQMIAQLNHAQRFSRHVWSLATIQRELNELAKCLTWSFDPAVQQHHRLPDYAYYNFVAPAHVVGDALTAIAPSGPLQMTQLMRFTSPPAIDVTPPQSLPIPRPDLLHDDIKEQQLLAELLADVRLTDYAITIQLINGGAVAHRWEHAVNRYVAIFDSAVNRSYEIDTKWLRQVAERAFRLLCVEELDRHQVPMWRLLETAEVHICKTFGEEALVTLLHRETPLAVWHIDFAQLALCSMGLAVDSLGFRSETGVDRL